MRKISLFVLTCLATSASLAVANDEWIKIAESESTTHSVNPARWRSQTKGSLQAWVKSDEKKTKKGIKYKYYLSDYRINCKEDSLYVASSTFYDSKGGLINSEKKSYPAFEEVIPESVGERILKTMCEVSQEARSELAY